MTIRWPLPPPLAAKAHAFRDSGAAPAPARVAATVLLIRPADTGFEVYLLRRAATMRAFGGMYAFPGGSVDASDADTSVSWAGPDRDEWGRRLGLPAQQAGAVVAAAVREVFEEAGVLLAGVSDSDIVANVDTADWEQVRQDLLARISSLTAVLGESKLTLRSDLLFPWARWITPDFEPRRFDTYFFLALVPEGQRPRDISGEADHTLWITPAEALRRNAAGEMAMLPPTLSVLEALAEHATIACALAAAADRDAATGIKPTLEVDPDGSTYAVF